MAQWYYAKADERLGPVDAQDLQARLESGELNGDTLVWREGMAQWQPARELATELAFNAPDSATLGIEAEPATASPAASPYAAPQAATYEPFVVSHEGDVVYAGFLKRFAASAIDNMVLSVVSMILLFGGMALLGFGTAFTPESYARGIFGAGLPLLLILLIYGIQALYYSWMTASDSHATLGKMAVGIKVVRSNGEGLSLGRSFGRWAAFFGLAMVTCNVALLVSAFMSGLTARKQGLHDMMVDSLVVDKWAFTGHPERQRRELGVVTWIVLGLSILMIVGYIGLLAIGVFAGIMGQH
ncbi:Uncharacterized membrane protein YckC, RDD family [Pseudoxanthomonas indica]|uniref:Uncharacterized membrane protein YckC, RDD family n=1 Tax=Pseudoxanthomonas indica TaxID=428993 RepID=A0A1T5KEP3_9GAMM|nr:RDD family protein [Pseudoxanthomonas indica]GGD48745.1 hypothetical protein GCM10007235_20820 [Pseudoxanthomonas indica]SKC61875.1 Uncharacterized membrane protein YckC, RDD family [Pseudoxanthomonas indica]